MFLSLTEERRRWSAICGQTVAFLQATTAAGVVMYLRTAGQRQCLSNDGS